MNAGLFRALPDRHVLTKDGPRRMKAESPTSDYGDESMDANDSLDAATEGYSIGPSKSRPVVSSSQQASGCAKPPYSFSCLIFMAIEDSEEKALPVKSIYAWVQHHFPYFRTAPAGWKNSVRHNLSLNKCFSKVDKSPALGKGSLWMVDPAHRPNLLQSLSKVPSHPHGGNDKVFMLSTRASGANRNRNSDPVNRISVGNSASRPLSSSTYTSSGGLSTPSNRQLFISSSSSQPCEPSYHASSMSSSSSSSKQVPHRNISSSPVSSTETPLPRDVPSISSSSLMSATNSPDPTLFPFLARRLGGLGTHVTSSETSSRSGVDSSVPVDVSIEKLPGVGSLAGVGIEDVDAANAMLTLKHGHKAMAPLQEALLSLREGVARQQNEESYLRHKRKLSVPNPGTGEPSSSTQDNSYGPHYSTHSTAGVTLYSLPPHSTSPWSLASHSTSPCSSSFSSPCSSTPPTPPLAPSTSRGKVRSRVGTSAKGGDAGSPTSSVDEAFSDGSFESDVGDVGQQSPSDFQQMVDGADALLNFAARATTLMPQLLMCRVPEDNQHPNAVRTLHAPRPRPNIPSSFSYTQPAVDRTNPTNPTKVSSHQSANSAECRSGSERLFSPIQDHGTSVKTDGDFEEDDDDDLFCSETLEPLPKRAMIESSGERLASPLEEDASSVRVFFGNDSRMSASVDCASAAPDRPEHRPSYSRDQLMQKQSFTTRSNLLKNHPLKTGIGSKLGKARLGNEASEKAVRPSTTVKKVSKPRRNAASKLGARPMMAARR